jgi:hypothetical protein
MAARTVQSITDRLSDATPGAWSLAAGHLVRRSKSGDQPIGTLAVIRKPDGDFIENATADMAYLLEIIRAQEAAVADATREAEHWKYVANGDDGVKVTSNATIAAMIELAGGEVFIPDKAMDYGLATTWYYDVARSGIVYNTVIPSED